MNDHSKACLPKFQALVPSLPLDGWYTASLAYEQFIVQAKEHFEEMKENIMTINIGPNSVSPIVKSLF